MKCNFYFLLAAFFFLPNLSLMAQDTTEVLPVPIPLEEDSTYYDEEYEEEYYQEEYQPAKKKSNWIGLMKIGIQTSFPANAYRNRTVRSGVGFDFGMTGSTKNKNFFVGGGMTYHYYDSFRTDYLANDSEGFLAELEETLTNQQFTFYGEGRYMPDISTIFQPYLSAQVGLRYRYTSISIYNDTRDLDEDSFVHEKTWVMQYGVGLGCIIRIRKLMFEISGSYLEAQAGTHLLRLPDWRTRDLIYTTDAYKAYRTPAQEFILHIGMLFYID